jgi:hypothetical protein
MKMLRPRLLASKQRYRGRFVAQVEGEKASTFTLPPRLTEIAVKVTLLMLRVAGQMTLRRVNR